MYENEIEVIFQSDEDDISIFQGYNRAPWTWHQPARSRMKPRFLYLQQGNTT